MKFVHDSLSFTSPEEFDCIHDDEPVTNV